MAPIVAQCLLVALAGAAVFGIGYALDLLNQRLPYRYSGPWRVVDLSLRLLVRLLYVVGVVAAGMGLLGAVVFPLASTAFGFPL